MWAEPAVCGLFSLIVGSFSGNVGLSAGKGCRGVVGRLAEESLQLARDEVVHLIGMGVIDPQPCAMSPWEAETRTAA
jgi:hypothetical protein